MIQQRWSGWSMTETAGAWGDTGEGPRGQEVTWSWGGFSKQADQRQPRGHRRCGREALHAPTGDTSVHFLWNVSGIPGNQPTSTTSLARGTHPLTGNWNRAPLLGSCIPAVCAANSSTVTRLSPPEVKPPERQDELVELHLPLQR